MISICHPDYTMYAKSPFYNIILIKILIEHGDRNQLKVATCTLLLTVRFPPLAYSPELDFSCCQTKSQESFKVLTSSALQDVSGASAAQ